MPLPIEVNHVLGRRMLTLAYRDADAPVVVGRSRDCDVQIPSVSVGTRHCMLFVHEGQWLLQESPGFVVTVNGAPVAGPVALKIGDVIGIGPEPKAPTIQIDPAAAAAGHAGPAVEAVPAGGSAVADAPTLIGASAHRTIRPPKPTPIAGEVPPQLSTRNSRLAVVPLIDPEPEPVPDDADAVDAPVHEGASPMDDAIDFGMPAAVGDAAPIRRRRQPQGSGMGAIVALFIVVLAGLGGLILWAWNHKQANLAENPPTPTQSAAPTQPSNPDTDTGPNTSIFGDMHRKPANPSGAGPATPPSTVVTGNPDSPPPAPPSTPPAQTPTTTPADPSDTTADDNDPDWLQVLTAHNSPDHANAIMRFDSYRQENQGKHTKELDQFEGEAMEKLWWQRVYDLVNHRADLDKDIAKTKTDLTDQPAGDFHKELEHDLADFQQKRDAADQELTTKYGYTLPTPPDLDDQAALAQLDAQRDADHFEKWKKNTLIWIREHNGRTPWADE